MKLTTILLQLPPVPTIEGDAVNALLGWIIIVLIATIVAVFAYFKVESKGLKTELKEDKIYIRQQDGENIKLIASVNIVLNQLVKQTDKGNDDLTSIKQNIGAVKPIITDNVQRLLDIHHNVIDLKKNANG